ncbi:citrate synthase [Streptomyces sp. NBC_00102]|uniref:citrate synthase n=1 Tax=Streptomyces sp. NBC_00102 TaxID=2975652 RepID=UPI002255AC27|nr:citrate synthase [Streptomyces sp. NBC_00102]MCX5400232.1 citrate synthase [Streptomyces sp. NBC_00102]
MTDQRAHGFGAGAAAGDTGAAGNAGSTERLSTRETAALLGVKPETVYAYVSRGQLSSVRAPGGRGSTFDADEVRALARRTGRREAPPTGEADLAFRTGITLIDQDRYYYRGVDAGELALNHGYEEVAEWLWTGELRPGVRFSAPAHALTAARQAAAALPAHSGTTDLLRVAVIAASAADPLRFDLSPASVLDAARGLIPTLVGALPPATGAPGGTAPSSAAPAGDGPAGAGPGIAARLWPALTARPADPASLAALDTALALLIDHDLAASTLAVRVAASAHAHPYAVVSAGLGALEGPLHGAASGLAHRMLREVVERGGAAPVVANHLRAGARVPGLGHRLYSGEDPRARVLFTLLEDVPEAAPALAAARDVVSTAARQVPLHANVDLALAVLSVSMGMPAEAGETVFAVARTAGWIAHALEEYAERPLRLRPRGRYTGPPPPQELPSPVTPSTSAGGAGNAR